MRLVRRFSILCLILGAPVSALARPNPARAGIATVIALEGRPEWKDGEAWKPVSLGQLFGPGDRLRCGPDASLQCVVNGVLGLALDSGTEGSLPRQAPGAIRIQLLSGRLAAFADPGQAVEINTGNALIQSGPGATDLEATADGQGTQLNTAQAGARLSDPKRIRTVDLPPYNSALLGGGRLMGPDSLGKRDLSDMNARWERARLFFGQRKELLKAMDAMAEHADFVRALKKRQSVQDQRRIVSPAGE